MTSPNSSAGKKDLHVGGIGSDTSVALASVIAPLVDASEDWLRKARRVVTAADDYVRENPWQALGAAALLSMALGYLAARRGSGASDGARPLRLD